MLEWSKTVPKRTQKRPAEQSGDFDDQVRARPARPLFGSSLCPSPGLTVCC